MPNIHKHIQQGHYICHALHQRYCIKNCTIKNKKRHCTILLLSYLMCQACKYYPWRGNEADSNCFPALTVHLLSGVIQENNYFYFQKRFSCTKIMYSNGQQYSSSFERDFVKGQTFFNTMDHSQAIIKLYKCFYNSVRSISIGTLMGFSLFWLCNGNHSVRNETMTVMWRCCLRVFTSILTLWLCTLVFLIRE